MRKCVICFRAKEDMNVLTPCMHIVCHDCLSLWTAESGQRCPICRTLYQAAFSVDEKGEVKPAIAKKIEMNYSGMSFQPPKGNTFWDIELRKKWDRIPQRIWDIIQEYGLTDQNIVSYIMATLSKLPQADAKLKISELLGEVCPNIIDKILVVPTSIVQLPVVDSSSVSDYISEYED